MSRPKRTMSSTCSCCMYSRCGDINSSLATFENLKVKYVVSGTTIIMVLASGNQALQAVAQDHFCGTIISL
ncbi:hypothetical protein RND71_009313 [Anisodus tanguticus]|uniref:Uncharacterized protein n=1 Tax=Anisodus tanguticus TaxID=243964 RepID=A0AAE1SF76_9SOLA|nr:hypothetical protein RND71_009313 [Anisodus tanguticus]